ncbi:hypothetical protein [Streptomyces sp. NPDC058632]|uniref:hypothetical protein n=1 Tax=Streptomyces sp. NPDC058632 TaxID=3346567 RepID=UPI0036588E2F
MRRVCGEGAGGFRLGTDQHGNGYIAIAGAGAGAEYLTASRDALRRMILDIKAGKADHLL